MNTMRSIIAKRRNTNRCMASQLRSGFQSVSIHAYLN
jgi:hypothetical protein